MTTITRLRERHSHPATTSRKLDEIESIARRYQALVRETVHRHWANDQITVVLQRPFSVVTARRRSGASAAYGLASNYQSNAVRDGLDIVRGSWQQAFAAVRSRAACRLNDVERHEINWLLRWPTHLEAILRGETVVPDDARFAGNDHARLCRWLARELRGARPRQPQLRARLAFEVDNTLFRVVERPGSTFPIWLVLTGLERGKRLRIPMSGSDTEFLAGTGNLRVTIETDARGRRRIAFRRAEKIEVVERTGPGVVGIDKGISVVITATDGTPESARSFGSDYSAALSRASARGLKRGRSRYWSLCKSATDRQKAARIRRNNLGAKRRAKEARRARAELRNIGARAVREMVAAYPDASLFVEEALTFSRSQSLPKRVNRKLARWTKRQLSRDIERVVAASGARRQTVNAAYTSQACPRCSWTDRSNRRGEAFACRSCDYAGRADAVAASNVRFRASDPTITRYTPHPVVKQMLLDRHVAARTPGVRPGDRSATPGAMVLAPSEVF